MQEFRSPPEETKSLQINGLLGIETSTLALPSPAAGVAFVFDPATGTSLPSRESFGPILSDRAETLGNHRFPYRVYLSAHWI